MLEATLAGSRRIVLLAGAEDRAWQIDGAGEAVVYLLRRPRAPDA